MPTIGFGGLSRGGGYVPNMIRSGFLRQGAMATQGPAKGNYVWQNPNTPNEGYWYWKTSQPNSTALSGPALNLNWQFSPGSPTGGSAMAGGGSMAGGGMTGGAAGANPYQVTSGIDPQQVIPDRLTAAAMSQMRAQVPSVDDLAKRYDIPGVSRSPGTASRVATDMMRARMGLEAQAQQIPLQDRALNAKMLLQGQQARDLDAIQQANLMAQLQAMQDSYNWANKRNAVNVLGYAL